MQRIAEFSKVSEDIFVAEACSSLKVSEKEAKEAYANIRIPRRATKGSAGYDFFVPFDMEIEPGQTRKIPTGIRARIEEGWVLMIYPRSGLGFRYRFQLDNTVGVIDSDYFDTDNEGHIMIKMTNCSKTSEENIGKTISLHAGEAFSQGVFTQFGITVDDEADGVRNGGLGSTS